MTMKPVRSEPSPPTNVYFFRHENQGQASCADRRNLLIDDKLTAQLVTNPESIRGGFFAVVVAPARRFGAMASVVHQGQPGIIRD
jgi:hypothetical protein